MQSDIDHFEINVLPLKPEPPPEALAVAQAVPLLNLGDSFLPLCTTELLCTAAADLDKSPRQSRQVLGTTMTLVSTAPQELLTARSSRGRSTGRAASARRGRGVLVSGWVVGEVSRLMSVVLGRSHISQPATTATARLLLQTTSHCTPSHCQASHCQASHCTTSEDYSPSHCTRCAVRVYATTDSTHTPRECRGCMGGPLTVDADPVLCRLETEREGFRGADGIQEC